MFVTVIIRTKLTSNIVSYYLLPASADIFAKLASS